METHIARSLGSTAGLFDAIEPRPGGRVLAICGVTVDGTDIVTRDPSCSWCARKLEEKETDARIDRIARMKR